MITNNQIFDFVESRTNTSDRPVYCASRYELVPDSFPCAYISEVSRVRNIRNVTFDFNDEQYRVIWEVQVFSDKTNGGLAECYSIIEDVERAFNEMYFRQTMRNQVTSADPKVTRVVARFERIICAVDEMPVN